MPATKEKPKITMERVELQAPPGWTSTLDTAAKQLGLSRSAYIRLACARQMEYDRRARMETTVEPVRE